MVTGIAKATQFGNAAASNALHLARSSDFSMPSRDVKTDALHCPYHTILPDKNTVLRVFRGGWYAAPDFNADQHEIAFETIDVPARVC